MWTLTIAGADAPCTRTDDYAILDALRRYAIDEGLVVVIGWVSR